MEIYERLKLARIERGIKQKDLAQMIEVTPSSVLYYENGKRPLTPALIHTMADILNVNEEWLKTGEGSMDIELSEDEEIAALIGEILAKEGTNPKIKSIIKNVARMDDADVDLIFTFAERLVK